KSGLATKSFNSDYGIFYSLINYSSYLIIETIPSAFTYFDINLLTSIWWAAAISLICIVFNTSYKKDNKIPAIVLLLALSCTLQARDLQNLLMNFKIISWGNMPNNNILGLLIVSCSALCCQKQQGTFKSLIVPILLSYIIFNYNLLFWPAIVFICSALHNKDKKIINHKTILQIIFSLIVLNAITAYTFNYSYSQYITEVYANIEMPTLLGAMGVVLTPMIYFLIKIISEQHNILPFNLKHTPLNLIWKKLIAHRATTILNIKRELLKNLSLNSAIAITLITVSITNTLSVFGAIFIFTATEFISTPKHKEWLKNIIALCCMVIIIANSFSLLRIGVYKFFQETTEGPEQFEGIVKLDANNNYFVMNKYNGLEYFNSIFDIEHNPFKQNFYQNISYNYNYNTTRWSIPFYNTDYVKMLNKTVTEFQKMKLDKNEKVIMLGYINPLPLLLGTAIPNNSYHRIKTKTKNLKTKLEVSLQENDFVFLPLFTINSQKKGQNQTALNCGFYNWNFINKKFSLVKITENGLFFTTPDKIRAYNLPTAIADKQETITRVCNEIFPAEYA
ncbi:MAG: hypothetical protein HON78_01170, partial [Legionellales bacterium]|nr:hypothetical protein [Legionellales bacterium]